MAEDKTPKKSQKRVDRQQRKAERQRLRELSKTNAQKNDKYCPIKVRKSKKSLPGFLAKNVNAIQQWLKDYQTLFVMMDDYGIQKLDRLPEDRRAQLVQNYVDVVSFNQIIDQIKAEEVAEKESTDLSCKVNNNHENVDTEESST